MDAVRIEGNRNIANTGIIQGSCIANSTIINLEFKALNIYKMFIMNEKETSLVNMIEAQRKLAEAIETFAQAEFMRAEANKLRAKADENNSLANLNYSKVMIEDRSIIKQMMDKLDS